MKPFSLFSFKASKGMKAMGVSLVYAMLVRGSVLNFGLLQDFTVDYLILCVNEGNAKFLISYYNWYYFRIYRFTVIQNDPIRIAEQIRSTTGKATDLVA